MSKAICVCACIRLPVFLVCTLLQVTLSRDGGTGDYALEAGALVLADQGTMQLLQECVCLLN